MGVRRKIAIQKPEVRLFLEDDVSLLSNTPSEPYNLITEFEKTSKNKSWLLIFVITGVIFFTGLLAFGMAKYIQHKNDNIDVSVSVFEDLNLKKLLNMVGKIENSIKELSTQKTNLEMQMQEELNQAEIDYTTKKYAIDTMPLSLKEKKTHNNTLNHEFTTKKMAIKKQYEPNIVALESAINDYQGQLTKFDSRSVEQAQAQQDIIDSQSRRFELEKQQLAKNYENTIQNLRTRIVQLQQRSAENEMETVTAISDKYKNEINLLDPILTDERGNEIVNKFNSIPLQKVEPLEQKLLNFTEQENMSEEIKNNLTNISSLYNDIDYLYTQLENIPFKNSMHSYLAAIQQTTIKAGNDLSSASVNYIQNMSSDYENRLTEQISQIEKLNNTVKNLQEDIKKRDSEATSTNDKLYKHMLQYFQTISLKSGEAGLIVSTADGETDETRETRETLVYISPLYVNRAVDSPAYVFNHEGTFLGTGKLQSASQFFLFEYEDAENPFPLTTGDRILLDIVNKQ